MNDKHYLAAVIAGTKPPKHMRARNGRGQTMTNDEINGLPTEISLDRLIAACRKRGVDIHDVIARGLSPEILVDEKSGMNVKAQTDLAWKLVDKALPSKQAVKHSGDSENPLVFTFSKDDEDL